MVISVQVRLCFALTRTFSGISKLTSLYLSFLTIFSFSSINFNFPSCHIIPTALHSAALCSATPVRIAYPAKQTNVPKGHNDELNGLADTSDKYIYDCS
jgi:hypothetical protein